MSAGDIEVLGPVSTEFAEILTPKAMGFVATLARQFEGRRQELLQRRVEIQAKIDAGIMPDFLPETEHIRKASWRVAPVPTDLQDRRVEITGPCDRRMIINALNSGANVYMTDFEDAHSPLWNNTIQGQINIRDAMNGTIKVVTPDRTYQLNEEVATLIVRPRGWHLDEKHVLIDGRPISAALFDFGICFYHNARTLLDRGTGPYYYLPKTENHLEARLWNDTFVMAQDMMGVPRGSIKATVLLETILAAFEMDEILYELREHSGGLNCGRWDYIFSFIKKFRNHSNFVLPDRALVTMDVHFLKSYVDLLIQTCHRRGAYAMGGMAAQIPIRNDPEANEAALGKVRSDKQREVAAGHDGTWIAHPGLVQVAKEVFDAGMPGPNQLHVAREDVKVTAADLLTVPKGPITEAGLRLNVNVGLLYLETWFRGTGAVALFNLMEDAATAEISRSQIWQWIRHGATLQDGRTVTVKLFKEIFKEEQDKIKSEMGEERYASGKFDVASEILDQIITSENFAEFLTLPAYDRLVETMEGER